MLVSRYACTSIDITQEKPPNSLECCTHLRSHFTVDIHSRAFTSGEIAGSALEGI